jgi:hypothetical protein
MSPGFANYVSLRENHPQVKISDSEVLHSTKPSLEHPVAGTPCNVIYLSWKVTELTRKPSTFWTTERLIISQVPKNVGTLLKQKIF